MSLSESYPRRSVSAFSGRQVNISPRAGGKARMEETRPHPIQFGAGRGTAEERQKGMRLGVLYAHTPLYWPTSFAFFACFVVALSLLSASHPRHVPVPACRPFHPIGCRHLYLFCEVNQKLPHGFFLAVRPSGKLPVYCFRHGNPPRSFGDLKIHFNRSCILFIISQGMCVPKIPGFFRGSECSRYLIFSPSGHIVFFSRVSWRLLLLPAPSRIK